MLRLPHPRGIVLAVLLAFACRGGGADFSEIEPLFQQHCVECHGDKEPEGGLVLESFEGLLKGGETGAAIVAGQGGDSLLVKALEGRWGKTGKNQFMPPGKRERVPAADIARIKAWIDAGAPAPKAGGARRELDVPAIAPKVSPRRAINALAFEPKSKLLAVGRNDGLELVDTGSRRVVRTLAGQRGPVNAVSFSPDGRFVFAAAGQAGLAGELRQWLVADGTLVRTIEGHRDSIQALAVTTDGQTVATGSYDYGIKLWDLAEGSERRAIQVHQGAITALSFRPDGKMLASSSFDRTAKLVDVASGERLETLGQALKELNAAAFAPGGQLLVTGGNDNRIRVYKVSPEGKEGSNELQATVFAHEGGILRLVFSADGRTLASAGDDRTVKLHEFPGVRQRAVLELQPDWPTALAFLAEDKTLAVGRADGTLGYYRASDGGVAPPPKVDLARVEPRGVQRGVATRVQLIGMNLDQVTAVLIYRDGLHAALAPEWQEGVAWVTLEPPSGEQRRAWEIAVLSPGGESGRAKVWVDDVPQLSGATALPASPASIWGAFVRAGQVNEYEVATHVGQTLIFDLRARELGSKANASLSLVDASGHTLATNDDFDGAEDPFLAYTFPTNGLARLRVAEQTLQGSSVDHYYRLTVGELPFVTGVFPLALPPHSKAPVQLVGFNLPARGEVEVPTGDAGEVGLPPAAAQLRARREWKFLVNAVPSTTEKEPNDDAASAQPSPVPGAVDGRLAARAGGADTDVFAFEAKAGDRLVIETVAATRGSLADTRLEVLWPDGRPVERVRLQAVRNSAITFRNETSEDTGIRFENWEEMELNDLLYANGEVMKLFRAPQGPDSDSILYSVGGKRRGFFDTTPLAQPLEQPVFVVEPLASGARPLPNGLPVFTLNYENDDDAERRLGTDARLYFSAPMDGRFLARVTDARGFGGERYAYRLVIRPAQPDFAVTLAGANATVAPGSGQGFTLTVNRLDGFEGAVRVELEHLPAGWRASSPLLVEAGHEVASGTLTAAPNARQPTDAEWDGVTVVAQATVDGRPMAMAVNNLGRPKLAAEKAKLMLMLEPLGSIPRGTNDGPRELFLAPGTTVKARLSVVRNGFDGAVRFEAQNLPHGVIVDNIGLNGITLLSGETEREIFLTCARWVADQDRLIHLEETAVGRQTTAPVWLKIRRGPMAAMAK